MKPKGTLLIVDDDMALLMNLKAWFEQASHRVHIALTGAQALEILRTYLIDVLIVDYILPGMDGITIIEKAMGIRPFLQTILFTGYGDLDSAKRAMVLGVRAYVEKDRPVAPEGQNRVLLVSKDEQTDVKTLQAQVERLIRTSYRYLLVGAMNAALRLWEIETQKKTAPMSKYAVKAELAEACGLWKVQNENGILRTRGLDRYLEMDKLPTRPRKDLVLGTLWFVIERFRSEAPELAAQLAQKAEQLEWSSSGI